MKTKVGIIGLGTVGGGVYDLSVERDDFEVVKVLNRSHEKYAVHGVEPFKTANGIDEVVEGSDVIVETVGGIELPFEIVEKSLNAGKDVVTANKELMAEKGVELLELARRKGKNLLFGASVGGGMPVLSLLRYHACGEITRIYGILNATSNFVLSKMSEGISFEASLKTAQNNGYAEADPTDDVEGLDAARKLAIMCAAVTGELPDANSIPRTGLVLDRELVGWLEDDGMAVKPIVYMEKREDGIELWVGPAAVERGSRIGSTCGTENCIVVEGTHVNSFLSGSGAGRNPTAFAVLHDLVSIINGEAVGFNFKKAGFKILKSEFEEVEKVKILKFSSFQL